MRKLRNHSRSNTLDQSKTLRTGATTIENTPTTIEKKPSQKSKVRVEETAQAEPNSANKGYS